MYTYEGRPRSQSLPESFLQLSSFRYENNIENNNDSYGLKLKKHIRSNSSPTYMGGFPRWPLFRNLSASASQLEDMFDGLADLRDETATPDSVFSSPYDNDFHEDGFEDMHLSTKTPPLQPIDSNTIIYGLQQCINYQAEDIKFLQETIQKKQLVITNQDKLLEQQQYQISRHKETVDSAESQNMFLKGLILVIISILHVTGYSFMVRHTVI